MVGLMFYESIVGMKLRRINKGDLETRVAWMNNPMVYSSMHYSLPVKLDDTIRWYDSNRENDSRVDVCFEENHTIMAFGGITSIDSCLKKGELYVFVSPSMQKRGIGTQAVRLLCSFGFKQLGLHKIYLLVNEDNNHA